MTAVHHHSSIADAEHSLAAALRAAHAVWIGETSHFLSPLLQAEVPFWDRWTAVRYMADRFLGQYRRERAFLDEVLPFLPAATAERLIGDGDRIGQLQDELDRVGRRRGTGPAVGRLGRELMDSLPGWCAGLEEAVSRIPEEWLSEEGSQLLGDIALYSRIHR